MRFQRKPWKPNPLTERRGERRVLRRFVWFPECRGRYGGMVVDRGEWRWLEWAYVLQEVVEYKPSGVFVTHGWATLCWGPDSGEVVYSEDRGGTTP